MKGYDFGGWATRFNLKCSDGRTICHGAFDGMNGKTVPLVFQHNHSDIDGVLGHAMLECRPEGVYAYGKFNNTTSGKKAREQVRNGDLKYLSIYANQLEHKDGMNVVHGVIRELSLVLSGANPGAVIDYPVLAHSGETIYDEAIMFMVDENDVIEHSDKEDDEEEKKKAEPEKEEPAANKEEKDKMADDKTVKEVFDTLTEEQKNVVYFMIAAAMEEAKGGEEDDMKHNVFDGDAMSGDFLSHEDMKTIIDDAKRFGSLKESVLQHSAEYGIENIEYLFPDAQALENAPEFIKRDMDWVSSFMKESHHSPFSRIKSIFADITEDDARAKGYLKGNLKKEEVFSLLKRATSPTTVYKKQKLDRDDVVDITDFDVVAWLKTEMRMMLDEEIARAALIGDQRLASSDDKIDELCIRPIWTDADLFTIKTTVQYPQGATDEQKAKAFIKSAIKSRKNYKGSGNPTLYTTEDVLTNCLLIEDSTGRVIYDTIEKLTTALRVKKIVTVPVMEGVTRTDGQATKALLGIIVNPADYNFGADKGGSVNMFDDFDIDYNAQKYLIETRCSGALTKPYSAIALEEEA